MKTMLIKVTPEDVSTAFTSITIGGARRTKACPLARALSRKTGGDATIGTHMAYYVDPESGIRMAGVLSKQAVDFRTRFDEAVDSGQASMLPWAKTFRLTFW